MLRTKVFAAYLPQYHITEDNNKFWGDGFTDWVGVKKAIPQFPGHNQPRVPLNHNYYDLLDVEVIRWQAKLAREYGISGFNIYHYWFKDGKQELENLQSFSCKTRILIYNTSLLGITVRGEGHGGMLLVMIGHLRLINNLKRKAA